MILENPTPEDIPMILSADGLLTTKGGSTSHAAVAAHGVDDRYFYAVMSAKGLRVDARTHRATIAADDGRTAHTIRTGDVVSIHGTTGAVYVGAREVERRG
jgi:pyruvate,orthophosphate dikinase